MLKLYPKILSTVRSIGVKAVTRLKVSGNAAHVIVRFIYTKTYEQSPLDGSTPQESTLQESILQGWRYSEFATCLE
jgi:hypothetical protein